MNPAQQIIDLTLPDTVERRRNYDLPPPLHAIRRSRRIAHEPSWLHEKIRSQINEEVREDMHLIYLYSEQEIERLNLEIDGLRLQLLAKTEEIQRMKNSIKTLLDEKEERGVGIQ